MDEMNRRFQHIIYGHCDLKSAWKGLY